MAIKLIIRRQGTGAGAPPEERTFDDPIITIGSDPAASLELSDPAVAPEQAIIISEDGRPLFINRAAGTRLNGEALAREARRTLSDGDTIHIGPYVIRFETGNGFRPGASAGEFGEETLPAFGEETLPAIPKRAANAPNTAAADAAPGAGAATPPQPERGQSSGTSFAAILDSLRTEEDAFYFQVETATRGRLRVPVEGAELLLGWDETGQNVACGDARAVPAVRSVVRKDWSGVVLQPLQAGTVSVNGEPVEAARRLHNGDRVTLLPPAGAGSAVDQGRNFFIFYEPASLVVLDALLPSQQFPPPVAAPAAGGASGAASAAGALVPAPASAPPAQQQQTARRLPLTGRKYFGYFTFGEIVLMACATLVAAAVIFLILEYS